MTKILFKLLPADIINYIIFPFLDQYKNNYDLVIREINMKKCHFDHDNKYGEDDEYLIGHLKLNYYAKFYDSDNQEGLWWPDDENVMWMSSTFNILKEQICNRNNIYLNKCG